MKIPRNDLMTVAQLINRLKRLPQDARVVKTDYDNQAGLTYQNLFWSEDCGTTDVKIDAGGDGVHRSIEDVSKNAPEYEGVDEKVVVIY